MEDRSRVIVLQGTGEERIRDAIMQGAVSAKVMEDVEAIKLENAELKIKLHKLNKMLSDEKDLVRVLDASCKRHMAISVARYDSEARLARKRKNRIEWWSFSGVLISFFVALIMVSIALIMRG